MIVYVETSVDDRMWMGLHLMTFADKLQWPAIRSWRWDPDYGCWQGWYSILDEPHLNPLVKLVFGWKL